MGLLLWKNWHSITFFTYLHRAQCGSLKIFQLLRFCHFTICRQKNSVKSTHLHSTKLTYCFHEIFFKWKQIFRFSTTCDIIENESYLKVEDDGPNEAKGKFGIAIYNVFTTNIHQFYFLVSQESQSSFYILNGMKSHSTTLSRLEILRIQNI